MPVPPKLQQKIVRLNFAEMRELLSETRHQEEEDAQVGAMLYDTCRSVVEIIPVHGAVFMAYLATIVKCARGHLVGPV